MRVPILEMDRTKLCSTQPTPLKAVQSEFNRMTDEELKPCDLNTLRTFEFERVLLESESNLVSAADKAGGSIE